MRDQLLKLGFPTRHRKDEYEVTAPSARDYANQIRRYLEVTMRPQVVGYEGTVPAALKVART